MGLNERPNLVGYSAGLSILLWDERQCASQILYSVGLTGEAEVFQLMLEASILL